MLTLPAEVLFEIEYELNEPRFMGVPIGSTLGSTLHLHLFMGHGRWNIKSAWKSRLHRNVRRFFLPVYRPYSSHQNNSLKPSQLLITWTKQAPRYSQIVLPIVDRIGPEKCTILGRSEQMRTSLPLGTEFIPWNALQLDKKRWEQEYRRCAPHWRNTLNRWTKVQHISKSVSIFLQTQLLLQSQTVAASCRLLHVLQPKGVLVEFDRSALSSCLVLSAKSQQIPTMTMTHGVMNPPYGYWPLLADVMFCWGQQSYDQMVQMGTDPSRLVITGYHRLTSELTADRHAARAKFGVTSDQPIALFASNPIAVLQRKQQVRAFCEAFHEHRDIAAVVRLHPSEKIQFYAEEISQYPSITFTEAGLVSENEALAAADIVIVRSSGFANDALLKQKPVVILDSIDAPLGNAAALIEQARCPQVKSSEDLRHVVKRIAFETQFKNELHRKAQSFVKYQFAAVGEKAADNITSEILKRTQLLRK